MSFDMSALKTSCCKYDVGYHIYIYMRILQTSREGCWGNGGMCRHTSRVQWSQREALILSFRYCEIPKEIQFDMGMSGRAKA